MRQNLSAAQLCPVFWTARRGHSASRVTATGCQREANPTAELHRLSSESAAAQDGGLMGRALLTAPLWWAANQPGHRLVCLSDYCLMNWALQTHQPLRPSLAHLAVVLSEFLGNSV